MAERNLDFDKVINRKNTRCLKYDFAVKRGKPADVLPLWVADMDFETSSYIEDALVERSKEGIFGYSEVQTPYFEIIANWMKLHHNWEIQEDWLIKTPGVVFALAMAVKAYTQPGDSVLIQLPVYYPFSEVIQDNGRKVVSSNLYQGEDNRYHIDFQDFEKKIVDNDVKAFILCSPHNPVGRVWRKEELKEMLEICHRHHVYVISDEIHQDFVFGNKKQTPSYLMTEHWDEILTITAPSKTFNLAGGQNSFVIIADENLRAKWDDFAKRIRLMTGNAFGFVAAEAAYKGGQEWLDKVKKQIVDNNQYLRELFKENLPKVVVTPLEATYLVWIDLRAYIKPEDTKEFIQKKCRLAVDFGDWFGGDRFNGFIRMNLATSRENVEIGVKHIIDGILGEK